MKNYILITLIGLTSTFYSCSQENKTMKNKTYNALIEYPYVASEQRANIIFDNMNKLKFGMNKKDVVQLLTLPDEINATYPSNVTAKDTIGFSYVYIIERKQENGSQNEKAEKLIRIHFDTTTTLINAYAIGIPNFNAIEKVTINTDIALPGSRTTIEEAIKKSMIIPVSDSDKILYGKPIVVKCFATEDPIEPGQVIVETCYYYHKFKVIEIISGNIADKFECDYITYIPNNEQNIEMNDAFIMILQESKAEGKYRLVKALYDTEMNRQEIKLSIEKLSGQNTIMPADYFLPEKFSKPLKWRKAENTYILNEQFYCTGASISIKNYNDAFNIIDTEKDFCRLYYAQKWCKANYATAFPYLLIRLTDTTKIGLNPFTDLYITGRPEYNIRNPMSTGGKPGILINEDIFTIAGRASWILNKITGENFATVQPSSSIKKLEQFKQNWINWIKTLE